MADLLSEQHGILQMTEDELLQHIMEVRQRRRTKPEKKKKVATKKGPTKSVKKMVSSLAANDVKRLMEMLR